jgi:hypothetical protein
MYCLFDYHGGVGSVGEPLWTDISKDYISWQLRRIARNQHDGIQKRSAGFGGAVGRSR